MTKTVKILFLDLVVCSNAKSIRSKKNGKGQKHIPIFRKKKEMYDFITLPL